jgi:hypothetical protein
VTYEADDGSRMQTITIDQCGKLMRNIPLYALFFIAASLASALDFSFEKDHCAAGEYRPKQPKSGGTSGLLDSGGSSKRASPPHEWRTTT